MTREFSPTCQRETPYPGRPAPPGARGVHWHLQFVFQTGTARRLSLRTPATRITVRRAVCRHPSRALARETDDIRRCRLAESRPPQAATPVRLHTATVPTGRALLSATWHEARSSRRPTRDGRGGHGRTAREERPVRGHRVRRAKREPSNRPCPCDETAPLVVDPATAVAPPHRFIICSSLALALLGVVGRRPRRGWRPAVLGAVLLLDFGL